MNPRIYLSIFHVWPNHDLLRIPNSGVAIRHISYPLSHVLGPALTEQSTLFLEQQQVSVCNTTSLAACTDSVQPHTQRHHQLGARPASSRILICNHETTYITSYHDPPSSSLPLLMQNPSCIWNLSPFRPSQVPRSRITGRCVTFSMSTIYTNLRYMRDRRRRWVHRRKRIWYSGSQIIKRKELV